MSEYIIEVDYDIRNGSFTQKRKEEITRCRDFEPDGFCAWAERKEVAE